MSTLSPFKQRYFGLCELHCHHCNKYVVFKLKPYNNGRLIIPCSCGHDHKRYCENGVVTSDRWGQSNSPIETIKAKFRRRGAHVNVLKGIKTYSQSLLESYNMAGSEQN